MRQDPIFIVGFPRSGTTFFQSLLATQANTLSFPETHFFSYVTEALELNEQDISKEQLKQIEEGLEEWVLFKFSLEMQEHLQQQIKAKKLSIKEVFEAVLKDYASQNGLEIAGKRLIEKSPRHCLHTAKIISHYPQAKFLAIIRNPLATCYSFYTKLNKRRRPYKEVAERLLKSINAIEACKRDFPQSTCIVKYEDLVLQQKETMDVVCRFLEIPFEPDKLENAFQLVDKYILPHETWKMNNSKRNYQIQDTWKKGIPEKDLSDCLNVLEEKMTQYDYFFVESRW